LGFASTTVLFGVGQSDIHPRDCGGRSNPTISGGATPLMSEAICERPGGELLPPPERRPLFVDAVIAFADFRLIVSGVGHIAVHRA
jgi:hypothetical protein